MATSRVQFGSEVVTIEHEAGIAPEQIKALARAKRGAPKPPIREPDAPTPPAAPDAVGEVKQKLLDMPLIKGPAGGAARTILGYGLPGTNEDALAQAVTAPIGGSWWSGPLKRSLAAGATGGAYRFAQTMDPAESLKAGATHAGAQAGGEVIPGIGRMAAEQRAGGQALRAFDTKSAAYKDAVATQSETQAAMTREHKGRAAAVQAQFERKTELAQASHAAQVREYAESGAKSIAEAYDAHVPAWQGMPTTERGLVDRVRGSGLDKMHQRFDESMKATMAAGRGKLVQIPEKDARVLNLRLPKIIKGPDGKPMAMVPADQLIEEVTGFWKKDPGVYRRAVAALDKANIGDPAARAEYKAAQSLIEFADKSQMLAGERFNPAAARKAFDKLKNVEILRRRGEGHAFEGPIAAAVRRPEPTLRLPKEPMAQPAPLAPDPVAPTPPSDVRFKTFPPAAAMARAGATVAEIPLLIKFLTTGQYHYPEIAIAGAAGGLGGAALGGRRLITNAPVTPLTDFATRIGAAGGAQAIRSSQEP